jgi:hypothetical protein
MRRVRPEHNLRGIIRLKLSFMSHNIDESLRLADYGNCEGIEVFFQPIEQNYNTPEDPQWLLHLEYRPSDIPRLIGNIERAQAVRLAYRQRGGAAQPELPLWTA